MFQHYLTTLAQEKKAWSDAKTYCENLGWPLFWDVNGKQKQLKDLWRKLDREPYWLGLYTEDYTSWKSVEGNVIDDSLLAWKGNRPKKGDGSTLTIETGKNAEDELWARLAAQDANSELPSACDKRSKS